MKKVKVLRCPAWHSCCYKFPVLRASCYEGYSRNGMPLRENNHCLWQQCSYYNPKGDNGLGSCTLFPTEDFIDLSKGVNIDFTQLSAEARSELISLLQKCITAPQVMGVVKQFPEAKLQFKQQLTC